MKTAMSRFSLSASGLRLASVCGRVNSLLKKGVFVEVGERRNAATGKANGLLDLSLAEAMCKQLPINADSAAMQQDGFDLAQTGRAA